MRTPKPAAEPLRHLDSGTGTQVHVSAGAVTAWPSKGPSGLHAGAEPPVPVPELLELVPAPEPPVPDPEPPVPEPPLPLPLDDADEPAGIPLDPLIAKSSPPPQAKAALPRAKTNENPKNIWRMAPTLMDFHTLLNRDVGIPSQFRHIKK